MHRNNPGPAATGVCDDDLGSILCSINDPATMRLFLTEILTPAERADLDLRWRLMQMLHRGMPQRTIASALQISLCKITRGSRVLKQPGAVTRRFLDRSRSRPAGSGRRHPSPIRRRTPPRRSVHP